jgi:hypothetical protein
MDICPKKYIILAYKNGVIEVTVATGILDLETFVLKDHYLYFYISTTFIPGPVLTY